MNAMEKKLLQRFINGACSAEETIVIQQWLLEHPDGLETYMHELWREDIPAPMPAAMEAALRDTLPLQAPAPVKYIHWRRWSAAAAVLLFLLAGSWLLQHQQHPNHALSIITAPAGKIYQLTLPDKSTAWLKGGSRLQFSSTGYGKQSRTIQLLSGEVFFDVKEDVAHPFIVEQGVIQTRVLGTSFSVKAATAHTPSIITVATGKVAVHYADSTVGVLVAGKRISVDSTNGQYSSSDVPLWAAAPWKESAIQLTQAGFDEVQLAIKELYGVQLLTDNKQVQQEHYTLLIKRQTSAREVITVLSLLNHHLYQQKNDTTYIIH